MSNFWFIILPLITSTPTTLTGFINCGTQAVSAPKRYNGFVGKAHDVQFFATRK